MKRSKIINLVAFIVCFSLMAYLLITPAFALTGAYDKDDDSVKEAFANAYGWDLDLMDEREWTDSDGNTYKRTAGYQKDAYDDLVDTSTDYAKNDLFSKQVDTDPMYDPHWNTFLDYLFDKYDVSFDDLTWSTGFGTGSGMGIVRVALAEVDAPDSMESPMGSNSVKYNDWYYGRHAFGEDYPWCAVFVSWCADQCGLIDDGTFLKTAGCLQAHSYFVNDMGFSEFNFRDAKSFGGSETVVPGDILFWYDGYGTYSHIGIITAVGDSTIDCVSGNYGDKVTLSQFSSGSLGNNLLHNAKVVHVEYPGTNGDVFGFLTTTMGFTVAGACGVMANLECESNFNPNALGDNGTSHGICQWHLDRWDNCVAFCESNGLDCMTIDGQLFFLQYELETGYGGLIAFLQSAPNDSEGAFESAREWCIQFERPANTYATADYRGSIAISKYWPMYGAEAD